MRQRVEKKLNQHLMLPIKLFMGREKSGGIVLILSVALAMILANSNIAESYFHFFEQEVGFIVNGEPYLNYSLHHWINDGLMAMFFFVVGLELKREFIGGELADIRNTILPIGAAIGGMIVPALIFLSLNIGTPQTMGWGIPMATDIAIVSIFTIYFFDFAFIILYIESFSCLHCCSLLVFLRIAASTVQRS